MARARTYLIGSDRIGHCLLLTVFIERYVYSSTSTVLYCIFPYITVVDGHRRRRAGDGCKTDSQGEKARHTKKMKRRTIRTYALLFFHEESKESNGVRGGRRGLEQKIEETLF